MEENNNINNEKSNKKGSLIGASIIIIILLLGAIGFICYDKFYKKEPIKTKDKGSRKEEEQEQEEHIEEYTNINSVADLEKIDFNDSNTMVAYWNYYDLYDYYLKMGDANFKDKKSDISDLKDYLKLEDGKLYWLVDGIWKLDDKISEKILYLDIYDSGYDGICKIEVFTESGKIYVIIGGWTGEDNFSYSKWLNDLDYYEVKYNGTLKNVEYKYFCECECSRYTYVKIDNNIFVLESSYDKKQFNGYILTPVEDFFKSFHGFSACGPNLYNLGKDGYLIDIFDENNKKIKVKDYLSFDPNYILIIDDNNNLYIITYKLKDNSDTFDSFNVKKIDTIKDSKFVYQDEGKSYGYIILSDDYKIEFNSFQTFFHK